MLDIHSNRKAQKYTQGELFRRVLWSLVQPFFRFSPRPCFGWRRWLLRRIGAEIGRYVHIYSTAKIVFPWNLKIGDYSAIGENAQIYNLGEIAIGQRVTISQGAHLCAGTHDYTQPSMPLLKLPISVGDDAWICADAFIGPNVTIGEGAVVGARAVAMKDVDPWTVVAGNPAVFKKERVIGSKKLSVTS